MTEWLDLLRQAFRYEEGGMLVVHPASGEGSIESFSASRDLLLAHLNLETVVLPGVGSSVIGAASLGRQVAEVTGGPVVAIITGYGLADMVSEALVGWTDFSMANRIRCLFAARRSSCAWVAAHVIRWPALPSRSPRQDPRRARPGCLPASARAVPSPLA